MKLSKAQYRNSMGKLANVGVMIAVVVLAWACAVPDPIGNTGTTLSGGASGVYAGPREGESVGRGGDRYRIRPGDIIELKVYQEDDLQTDVKVDKDGTAIFPLIGNVSVRGKTGGEAAELVERQYNERFLVNPRVTISIVEYAETTFTVLGQVKNPGIYSIPDEGRVTLLRGIAMAGGYTETANHGRVAIRRGESMGDVIHVNAAGHARNARADAVYLEPGDIVTVAERIF